MNASGALDQGGKRRSILDRALVALCLGLVMPMPAGAAGPEVAEVASAPSSLFAVDRNRVSIVEGIVHQWGASLRATYGVEAPAREAQLREALFGLRADRLLAASLAGTVEGLARLLAAEEGESLVVRPKNLGDPGVDVVYVPVLPCRLFDTRPSQGGLGILVPGVIRTYSATVPVAQQGGPGGCTAPAGTAVAMIRISTVAPPAVGLLQGGAHGTGPFPNALILYQPGDQYGASIPMPVEVATGKFDLVAQFNGTDVAGELLGYFRAPQGGYVSSVTAGSGLTGGTITSTGTIAADTAYLQRRVTGSCAAGSSIRSIASDGTVVCEADDGGGTGTVTSLSQGTGITLSANPITTTGSISADTTYLQRRVTGSCAAGGSIRMIASDGTVTCQNDGPANAFVLGGNNFGANAILGTNDDNPLTLRVNATRVMRYEPNSISPNVIGGHQNNSATPGVRGATIAGGGVAGGDTDPDFNSEAPNRVTDAYGAVGGGYGNVAGDDAGTTSDRAFATVGGGFGNAASGRFSTVGGGDTSSASGTNSTVGGGEINTASGTNSTVGGGFGNTANDTYGTVGGGDNNTASGPSSTVGGGSRNTASGAYSVAMGRRAKALGRGSFSFADSNDVDFSSATDNTFRVRASGGVRLVTAIDGTGAATAGVSLLGGDSSWNVISDRAAKTNWRSVDGTEILAKLLAMPIGRWNYKAQSAAVEHMGPTAQDFRAAYGLGHDDKTIATVDADGVALAAIQGLNTKLEAAIAERDARLAAQGRELAELKHAVEVLLARTSPENRVAAR